MYSVYISLALALITGIGWTLLEFPGGWILGVLLGIVTALVSFVLIARRIGKRLHPVIMQAQKQAQAGHIKMAIDSMESAMPLGGWIPLLKGQLMAQLGVLHLGNRDEDRAIEWLEKASPRAGDGKLHLAALYGRSGRVDDALRVLAAAAPFNRKHVLFHNTWAFLLYKNGNVQGAITALNTLLQKVPENEATKENLNQIRNGMKMSMAPFEMEWYALGLEAPPASMGQMQGRKGFRQPSKKNKKKMSR